MQRIFSEWEKVQAMRAVLAKRFPACFKPHGNQAKLALMIGIRKHIFDRAPDLNQHYVALALADYTVGPKYTKAMMAGAVRVDLDGNATGAVTEAESGNALFRERVRRRKAQDQRRDLAKMDEIERDVAKSAA